jgi:hypothetical protein
MFLFSKTSSSGVHPASCSVGTELLSPGVKRPESEGDHSHPSTAEVKSEWSFTSTPSLCLHGADKENFIFDIFVNCNLVGTRWQYTFTRNT